LLKRADASGSADILLFLTHIASLRVKRSY